MHFKLKVVRNAPTYLVPFLQNKSRLWHVKHVAADLEDLYRFLVKLYLPEECLLLPPRGGWPGITYDRFKAFEKDDEVVDLLKHIPYLRPPNDDYEELVPVFWECHANDFAGRDLQDTIVRHGARPDYCEPYDWTDSRKVALLRPRESDGSFLVFNVDDGSVEWSCSDDFPWEPDYDDDWEDYDYCTEDVGIYRSIADWCRYIKDQYNNFICYPVSDGQIGFTSEDNRAQVRAIFEKHGWPHNYDKAACLAEVAMLREEGVL